MLKSSTVDNILNTIYHMTQHSLHVAMVTYLYTKIFEHFAMVTHCYDSGANPYINRRVYIILFVTTYVYWSTPQCNPYNNINRRVYIILYYL